MEKLEAYWKANTSLIRNLLIAWAWFPTSLASSWWSP